MTRKAIRPGQKRTPAQKRARRLREQRNRRAAAKTAGAADATGAGTSATPVVDRLFDHKTAGLRVDRDVNLDQRIPVSGNGHSGPSGTGVPGAAGDKLAERLTRDRIVAAVDDARVRGVVHQMLGDGSLVRGLQASLERIAGGPLHFDQRYAEAAKQADGEDRRYTGEKLGHMNMNQTTPALRHREFLEQLDIELERIGSLIGGLDDRTKFLQFNGPSEPTNEARGEGGTRPGPSNDLEQSLQERVMRATVLRHRLEELHNALRI